jgi:hypothetical protein
MTRPGCNGPQLTPATWLTSSTAPDTSTRRVRRSPLTPSAKAVHGYASHRPPFPMVVVTYRKVTTPGCETHTATPAHRQIRTSEQSVAAPGENRSAGFLVAAFAVLVLFSRKPPVQMDSIVNVWQASHAPVGHHQGSAPGLRPKAYLTGCGSRSMSHYVEILRMLDGGLRADRVVTCARSASSLVRRFGIRVGRCCRRPGRGSRRPPVLAGRGRRCRGC